MHAQLDGSAFVYLELPDDAIQLWLFDSVLRRGTGLCASSVCCWRFRIVGKGDLLGRFLARTTSFGCALAFQVCVRRSIP